MDLAEETESAEEEQMEEQEEEEEYAEEEEAIEEEFPSGLLSNKITWEDCFNVWKGTLDSKIVSQLPLYAQLSFSQFLFDELVKAYGQEKAIEICKISNQSAPITVRINEMKITREEWLAKWANIADPATSNFCFLFLLIFKEKINEATICKHSPWGVTFAKRENLMNRPDFQEGLFEIQDEASQLIAQRLIDVKPGQHVKRVHL